MMATGDRRIAYDPSRPLEQQPDWDTLANTHWNEAIQLQNGRPVVQSTGEYRGFYISVTAMGVVDPYTIPYLVTYPGFGQLGVSLGDYAVVVKNGPHPRVSYAIVGDAAGSENIPAEGSVALHRSLGGAETADLIVIMFPNSRKSPRSRDLTADLIADRAENRFIYWGGLPRIAPL